MILTNSDVDKFATILEQRGVTVGQAVAVFTTNSPEMIIAYIALQKLGATPAMINTSLRSQTLAHCMNLANAQLLICTPDLAPAVVELWNEVPSTSTPCLSINLTSFPPLVLPDQSFSERITQIRYEDLHSALPSTTPLPKRDITDTGAFIYTSGTSGKPKAVRIRNILLVVTSTPAAVDLENPAKYFPIRTYSCLPLYHGTCLFTGLNQSVGTSGSLCLARKFSATNFSRDLVISRATRTLYVGELCRYLLRAPPSSHDKAHKVLVAAGNGLARDVWRKFQSRFAIPEIREFYRSTEGMASFDNVNGLPGAVGFKGPLARYFENNTFLVKYDPETEMPWRDPKTGFCVPASTLEPGEAIGRIPSMSLYLEYVDNPAANAEKIIRDVFVKGDMFQRMGDLLVRDRKGWVSFLDRTGDTYRWRGENVSAGEVRDHISRLPEVIDCSVHAVKLPAYDGQAGAVGITLHPDKGVDEDKFATGLYARLRKGGLTNWQVPRLLRMMEQIDTGATFKHAKEVLKKRSWDPEVNGRTAGDRLYWLDGEVYRRLEGQGWRDIEAGKARL